MKLKSIQGIIWDLDGTIIDSFRVFEQVIQDLAIENGLPVPSREHMLLNFHGLLSESIENVLELKPGNDEVTYRKPDKRAVYDWLERHNLDPSNVLVIGDQFVDAELANNLGARALLVARNGDIPHLPTHKRADHTVVTTLHGIELD